MALSFESVSDFNIPSLAYVQLIGLALGLDESALGVGGIGYAPGLLPCHQAARILLGAV